ncbi:MAG: hypothetical protein WC773_01760 [Patescibacteria group bacterium]|jgi:hypothetical protein
MGATSPSWDAVIVLVYVIGVGYSLILHRERIAGQIASAYISLAVTSVITTPVYNFLHHNSFLMNQLWVQNDATTQMVSGLLFLALTIILSSFLSVIPTGRKSDSLSMFESTLFSFLWVTLLISTILSFLPVDRLVLFSNQSKLITLIWQYHTAWLIIPAFLLIYSGFRRGNLNY